MYCLNCGKEISEKSRFCKYCGIDLKNRTTSKLKIFQKLKHYLKDYYNLLFLLVLFIASLLRLKYLLQPSVWNDSMVYLWLSDHLFSNPNYILTESPHSVRLTLFYLLCIKSMSLLIGNSILANQIVVFLFSIIGVIFTYKTGVKLGNKLMGLLGALLLSFNHLHWFFTDRILTDIPFTTMSTLFVYFWINYDEQKTSKNLVLFALIILGTVFTRRVGLITIPIILGYYLTKYLNKKFLKCPKKKILILLIAFLGLSFLLINPLKNMLKSSTLYIIPAFEKNFSFNVYKSLPFMMGWGVIFFSAIAIIMLIYYSRKEYYPIIIWNLGYLLILSLMLSDKVQTDYPRYLLPVLPMFFLLTGYLFSEMISLINIYKKKIINYTVYAIIILFTLFIIQNYYKQGEDMIKYKSNQFIGYPEAGSWLKENVNPQKDVIISSSPRYIRYFSGFNYAELSGIIYELHNKTYFEKLLNKEIYGSVYLEINLWESPSHIYPSQDTFNYLNSIGFELVHTVNKELEINSQRVIAPVIFIFKRTS